MYLLPKTSSSQGFGQTSRDFARAVSKNQQYNLTPQDKNRFRISTLPNESKTIKFSRINQQKIQDQSHRINETNLENTKLRFEMEHLKDKFNDIEKKTDVVMLQNHIKLIETQAVTQNQQLLMEITLRDKKINKLNVMYQSMMSQNSRLENEAKVYQNLFDDNNQKIEELEEDVLKFRLKSQKYMEIAWMQHEDNDSRIQQMREVINVAEKGKDKLQKLQMKADRYFNSLELKRELIEKSKEVEIPQNPDFKSEGQLMASMMDSFKKDQSFFKIPLSFLPPGDLSGKGSTINLVNSSNQDNYFNKQEIQLDKMRVSYPSFLIFIEHQKKFIEAEMNGIQQRKTSATFFPTMRSILDAKWVDLQVCQDSGSVCRFPEFTYGWLNNFCIDQKSRKIRSLTEQEVSPYNYKKITHADDRVVRLVVDLSNPLTNKSWECTTFKELINDCSSSDEIYFYLFCRNLLYRGPQMAHSTASFEAIHYISLPYVEFIVEHILKTQEQITIYTVKKNIREKALKKIPTQNIYIVDGGFVLRLLLEIYREERRNRYILLKQAFATQMGGINIGFKVFKRIVSNYYIHTKDSEIASLYRESASYGLTTKVGVNIDTFYTACSENGFFVRNLKLHSMIKHPLFEKDGKLVQDQGNMEYVHFMQAYEKVKLKYKQKKIMSERDSIGSMIERFGLEALVKDFQYFHNFFAKFQFKQDKCQFMYHEKNFIQIIQDYGDLLGKIRNIYNAQSYLQGNKEFNKQANEFFYQRQQQNDLQKKGVKNSQTCIITSLDNFFNVIKPLDSFQDEQHVVYGIIDSILEFPSLVQLTLLQEKKEKLKRTQAARRIQKLIRTKLTKFYSFVSQLLSAKLRSSFRITI